MARGWVRCRCYFWLHPPLRRLRRHYPMNGEDRRRGFRCSRHCAVACFDHRDLGPGLHRFAFLGQDLAQDAGDRGRHLCVDLVGVDLEHRLELDHLVTWLDEPLRDGAFVHRLAQLRHDDACRGGDQYAASSLRTFVILSGVGVKYFSIGMASGLEGTSSPPNRLTGASSQRHASSAMRAATSEPTETLKLSS